MHVDNNNPGLKKFRAARARDRKRWEKRQKYKEIMEGVPEEQLDEAIRVYERENKEHYIYPRNRFGRTYKVKVQRV